MFVNIILQFVCKPDPLGLLIFASETFDIKELQLLRNKPIYISTKTFLRSTRTVFILSTSTFLISHLKILDQQETFVV